MLFYCDWLLWLLTQQMGRDGPLQVDVLVAIFLVECAAHVGVQVLIERLQLLPQALQVLLECWRLVQGTPEGSVI